MPYSVHWVVECDRCHKCATVALDYVGCDTIQIEVPRVFPEGWQTGGIGNYLCFRCYQGWQGSIPDDARLTGAAILERHKEQSNA